VTSNSALLRGQEQAGEHSDEQAARGHVTGLSSARAAQLLAENGPNLLPQAARPSPWLMVLRQLTHFFAILLWVAVVLALLGGMPQLSVAITVVILVNGASHSLRSTGPIAPPTACATCCRPWSPSAATAAAS